MICVATWCSAGAGLKRCVGCGHSAGPRTIKCSACGQSFYTKVIYLAFGVNESNGCTGTIGRDARSSEEETRFIEVWCKQERFQICGNILQGLRLIEMNNYIIFDLTNAPWRVHQSIVTSVQVLVAQGLHDIVIELITRHLKYNLPPLQKMQCHANGRPELSSTCASSLKHEHIQKMQCQWST